MTIRFPSIVILLAVSLCARHEVPAQQSGPGDLAPAPSTPVEAVLAGGEVRVVRLPLERGQALHAVVEQRGIDVVVTLRGPGGGPLLEADSYDGAEGPERIVAVAPMTGVYELEVRAFDGDARPGRYELRVERVARATVADRKLAEAARLYAEGVRLRSAHSYDAARPRAERALRLRRDVLGSDHPDVAAALDLLGYIYDETGAFEKGRAAFAHALAIRERRSGPDDLILARTRSDLGWLLLATGDRRGAEAAFGEAWRVRATRGLGGTEEEVSSMLALGRLHTATGEHARAVAELMRALTVRERLYGPEHGSLAEVLAYLAIAHVEAGDAVCAEAVARRAETIDARRTSANLTSALVAEALGRALGARDPATAQSLVNRALEIRVRLLGREHPRVRATRVLLDTMRRLG